MTDYLSRKVYAGDGAQTDFSFPVSYIREQDVSLFVDGVEAAFSFVTPTLVRADAAPTDDSVVMIRRDSENEQRLVTFTSGSIRDPQTFNTNSDQLLYLVQEIYDRALDSMSVGNDLNWDAQAKRITGGLPGVLAGDFVTVAQLDAAIGGGDIVQVDSQRFSYTGDGSTTTFSISPNSGVSAENCFVSVNGLIAEAADYSMNGAGDAVVFATAPAFGDSIEIRVIPGQVISNLRENQVEQLHLADGAVGTAELINGSVTTAKIADGNVTTGKIADDAVTHEKIPSKGVHAYNLADDCVNTRSTGMFPDGSVSVKTVGAGTSYWWDKPALQVPADAALRIVQITISDSADNSKEFQLQISSDGSSWKPVVTQKHPASVYGTLTLTAFVPSGWYYKLVKTNGGDNNVSVDYWVETTLTFKNKP